MRAVLIAASLLLVAASPSPNAVSVKLLVGEWRSNEGTTYHFRADGTWSSHGGDVGDDGRWRLRSDKQLELIFCDSRGKKKRAETILIDRVVHETLYVTIIDKEKCG
jgi:hypothetical protein